MITKKIIGITLLATAGIYVAVKKFGKPKATVTPQTPLDESKVAVVSVNDSQNSGIVWNGSIDSLPEGFVHQVTFGAAVNGLNLLN